MTQKLEALHLEALCEEVREQRVCVILTTVESKNKVILRGWKDIHVHYFINSNS